MWCIYIHTYKQERRGREGWLRRRCFSLLPMAARTDGVGREEVVVRARWYTKFTSYSCSCAKAYSNMITAVARVYVEFAVTEPFDRVIAYILSLYYLSFIFVLCRSYTILLYLIRIFYKNFAINSFEGFFLIFFNSISLVDRLHADLFYIRKK